jgi:predicted nucleotidyltransferase component of viral defense system
MAGNNKAGRLRCHEDTVLFREAVRFTAAETRFLPRLIEKDYFCSLLLHYLTAAVDHLVFKGGTCLAKVHVGFYRLSEDLDFVVPMAVNASRSSRSKRALTIKETIAELPQALDLFRVIDPLRGANNSTQYVAKVGYQSLLGQGEEAIKIEIGLREPLLTPAFSGQAQTLLLNPLSGKGMVEPFKVTCISLHEAMAEKLRAALSRREPAIRDFYDIDFAVRNLGLQLGNEQLLALARQKLSVPGNEQVDVSGDRLAALRRQHESRLKAVLRTKDFEGFDLEHAFAMVADVATRIG